MPIEVPVLPEGDFDDLPGWGDEEIKTTWKKKPTGRSIFDAVPITVLSNYLGKLSELHEGEAGPQNIHSTPHIPEATDELMQILGKVVMKAHLDLARKLEPDATIDEEEWSKLEDDVKYSSIAIASTVYLKLFELGISADYKIQPTKIGRVSEGFWTSFERGDLTP